MAARDYRVEETLRNGTKVTIRAAQPDDRERIAKAFSQLEQESVYTRFFTYKRELSPAELDRVVHMDFASEAMLVATTGTGDGEIVIAGARYIAQPTPEAPLAAEVAFTVEEDFQKLGLARRLLNHLAIVAREQGIDRFEAHVLPQNKAMLAVFERSGLPVTRRRDADAVHVTLMLSPPA